MKEHLNRIIQLFAIIPVVFLISITWEFVIENTELSNPEETSLKWEFIFTATLSAAAAILIPIYLVIKSDISQREANAKLQVALAKANDASRAKGDFLASMSHELRTPMNAIIGFTEMIYYNAKDPIDGKNREYLEYVLTSGNHLLELINQVLELAKIESGNMELKPEVLSIQDIMPEVINLVASTADTKNISIKQVACCEKSKSIHVFADPLRFRQVMFNLISNAVKYNKPDGSVEISCMVNDEDTARIEVKDNGIGIPEDKHEEVFQPFNRLGLEGQNIEGSGVGLTITRDLIEQMNGRVGFTSKKGTGSTFWVDIPLAIIDADQTVSRANTPNS